jgi:AcrR family transcriptional regulator
MTDRPDDASTTQGRFTERVAALRDAEIRQTALNCFNENGCFKTDLDQVARLVGVGKGTVYRHYGSKQLLLKSTLETGMEKLHAACEALSQEHADNPRRAFELTVRTMVGLNLRRDPSSPATLSRLLCGCRWSGTDLAVSTLTDAFALCVKKWQGDGVLRTDTDATWMATSMLALINAEPAPAQPDSEGVSETLVDEATGRVLALVRPVFAAAAA